MKLIAEITVVKIKVSEFNSSTLKEKKGTDRNAWLGIMTQFLLNIQ